MQASEGPRDIAFTAQFLPWPRWVGGQVPVTCKNGGLVVIIE